MKPSARIFVIVLVGAATPSLAEAQVNVPTQHNDNARTGANLSETTLTPTTVAPGKFGLLFKRALDDQLYTQPLYLSQVGTPARNLVFVASVKNTVYAFDADDASATTPVWQVNLGTPQNKTDGSFCGTIAGNMGIIGTPTIDPVAGTLYVVAATHEGSSFFQRLHALNVATGAERTGSPVVITAPSFNPLQQLQRAALLLSGGKLYIGYSSHCDSGVYHGFIFSYDAATLAQLAVFNASPTTTGATIWQSGMGPAADAQGNVFFVTGNGVWDGVSNFSESFMKLGPDLSFLDWFTPTNHGALDSADQDLNSTGPLLVPGLNRVVDAGKSGILYMLDTASLGHLGDQNAVQSVQVSANRVHSLTYFQSSVNGPMLYAWPGLDTLKAYKIVGGLIQDPPFAVGPDTASAAQGSLLSISANGATGGILWANDNAGVLRAYDANNVATELWNSSQVASDACGQQSKNAAPTIVNGKVYFPSFGSAASGTGQLCVYGAITAPPSAPTGLTATEGSAQVVLSWNAVSGPTNYRVQRGTTSGGPYTVLTSAPTTNAFTDTTAKNGTTYYYVVNALNGSTASANSNQASAKPASGLVIVGAAADAYVRDGSYAALNYGTDTVLTIKANASSGYTRRTFVRFSISAPSTITSAKLRLYGNYSDTSGSSSTVVHQQASTSWGETTLTWNNQPAIGSTIATVTTTTTAKYWEWDVSSYVKAQKKAGKTSVSLELVNAANVDQPTNFNSRETGANPPHLLLAP